ncbi:MAG: carboxypeptidase regulatory-like domain-containing protein, partial [Anaerolineae bacterium]|nr:carboxypeptidase regulatory-like domain-containing protein [Anaerolineae bacterium]
MRRALFALTLFIVLFFGFMLTSASADPPTPPSPPSESSGSQVDPTWQLDFPLDDLTTPLDPSEVTDKTDKSDIYPLSIRVDRNEGGHYRIGERVTVCYTVPRAGQMRILRILDDGTTTVFLEGRDDGRGGCVASTAGAPPGRRRLRIEMRDGGGEWAETYYYVDSTGSSASLRIWLDRDTGSTYRIGESIRLCYTVPRADYMRITKTTSQGASTIAEWRDDGRGACLSSTVGAPSGWHIFRIEMLNSYRQPTGERAETNLYAVQPVSTEPPGGFCRARWVSAVSNYCSGEFGLASPQRFPIFRNYSQAPSPREVQFGPYDPSTNLVFYIRPGGFCGGEYLSTTSNARINILGTNRWQIGWEDLPPSLADDYNDLTVEIECGIQPPRGDFSGVVTDAQSPYRPIQGATISIGGPSSASTTTDQNGRYSFRGLTVGTYQVRAQHVNYQAFTGQHTVQNGNPTTYNISMTPIPFRIRLPLTPEGGRENLLGVRYFSSVFD